MLILILILILIVPFLVFSFTHVTPQEEVFKSLGDYEIVEYCQYGYIGDFTNYGKYTYEDPDLENNEYLNQMTEEDIIELNSYIDNYEEWVDVIKEDITNDMNKEFADTYDFDRDIISTKDYCYIYNENDYANRFNSYDLYFYDTETEIFYYFHNNI